MQQSFVERLSCAKARSAGSDRPAPPLPPGRFAPARVRGHAYPLGPAGKGPTQPAPVSPVPGGDNSDPRAPGAHRQFLSKGSSRCPSPTSAGSRRPEAEGASPEAPLRDGATSREVVVDPGPGDRASTMADWARAQSSGAVEEILDRENLRMADSLSSKVTRLKALALDIDRDAEDQNRYLDGMDSDFSSVTGLLTGSVKRFSTMARSGRDNRKLLCAVAMGLIVAFFILSYLLSRART
ncbi:BET1-like protein [Artibeus jamaicensis]|uniref:BET1-like protein n=1 Tax=Artibeus jamaicensis TaxID=9417 RepID=UPI00235B2CDF|nr:BET1-like protein [Artibeus jamaicensis]